MLVSLLGAVLVMAVGIALVRWGAEYRGGRAFDADGIDSAGRQRHRGVLAAC